MSIENFFQEHNNFESLHGLEVQVQFRQCHDITLGKICVENNRIYICQDDTSGDTCIEKFGYRYSWYIARLNEGLTEMVLSTRNNDVVTIQEKVQINKLLLKPDFLPIVGELKCKIAGQLISLNSKPYDGDRLISYKVEEGKVKLTYLPVNREPIFEGGQMTAKGRQMTTPSRVIRKVLPDSTHQELEEFANLLNGYFKDDIKEVSGEDIRYWYNIENYADYQDTLNNSCMAAPHKGAFLDIYCDNPQVKLAIMVVNGKLVGRALVWETDKGKFMDRIYGKTNTVEKFKHYAMANGYMFKKYQSMGETEIWTGEKFEFVSLKVNLDNVSFDAYPYMDTIFYLYKWGVSTECVSDNDYLGYCHNTDGGHTNRHGNYVSGSVHCTCYGCGDEVDEEDAENIDGHMYCRDCVIWDDIDQEYILDRDSVTLVDRRITHRNNAYHCDGDDTYVVDGNYWTCDHDGCDYSDDNKRVYIEDFDVDVHEDNVNDFYASKGYVQKDDGDWIPRSEAVEIDGEWVSKDDAIYCDGDDTWVNDYDDYFTCDFDNKTYSGEGIKLSEIGITVSEWNVDDAYAQYGYEKVDEKWIKTMEVAV